MNGNHGKRARNRRARRRRRLFARQHAVGASPGTLVIPADASKPAVRLIQYDAQTMREEPVQDVSTLAAPSSQTGVTWIDVQGLGDEALLRAIGETFRLHPLELEDIVNVPQRPKVQAYNHDLLIVTRMVRLTQERGLDMDQVSIVLGPNFVLTFQEHHGDVLEPVRNRIRQGVGLIRAAGPDYLAYAILDATIDGYYPVMESLGERLEGLEQDIIGDPRVYALHTVHDVKQELLAVRRGIWPLREAINGLIRDENPLIAQPTRTWLRDCYDHSVQIIDVVETYRELASSMMDLYLSSVANRQNDIMRVLTVIATIFMPLTFLTGIFGMNFEHLPGLKTAWGYPVLLAAMAVIAGGMLIYFGRKGWLRQ